MLATRPSSLLWLAAASVTATIVPAHTIGNASWPFQSYRTAIFTPPTLEITGKNLSSEGYLFLAPDGPAAFQTAPLIMDMEGELVWNGLSTHAFNFGVQQYKGEDVLVFWNGSVFPEPVGRGNGVVHLLNKSYESVANVTLPGNFVELTPNASYASNIDLHEIKLTPRGTVLVTANNVTQADLSSVGGPEDGWIVNCFVYEIDIATNEILFEWDSLSHLDQLPLKYSLYPLGSEGYTGATQEKAWGYFHINAVALFEDGYIVSSRYFCSAIAVGRDGRVKWRLQGRDGGDFTLGNGTNFCYQHDIRAAPSNSTNCGFSLHMHDNANSPIDNNTVPTSGLLLDVDIASKQVSLNKRYVNASGLIFSTAQGDYQPLSNGNVFLGHGWVPVSEEYAPSGEILSTIQYGAAIKRPQGGFYSTEASGKATTLSYRTFKQTWIGCPMTKPHIVAQIEDHGTDVYVSWNGATEISGWEIYGGWTAGNLSCIATVPRTGFETVAHIQRVNYAQARPVLNGSRCHYGEEMRSDVVGLVG